MIVPNPHLSAWPNLSLQLTQKTAPLSFTLLRQAKLDAFLQGASPCWVRPNQPPISSVAGVKEAAPELAWAYARMLDGHWEVS